MARLVRFLRSLVSGGHGDDPASGADLALDELEYAQYEFGVLPEEYDAAFIALDERVGADYWDDRCTFCGVHHPVYEGDRLDPWVRFRARPSLV